MRSHRLRSSTVLRRALLGVLAAAALAVAPGLVRDSKSLADTLQSGGVAIPPALWGADVRALAIHPEDPDLLAAGTSAGHIYLSQNGGRSWSDAGVPVPFPGWVVGTLRFDPHRPDRVWAALWGVWGSGLVAVSDDLGATWRERMGSPGRPAEDAAGALPREPVYDLVVASETPDHLYAGARSGVWLSRDAGRTWNHLTVSYPEIHHVSSLLVHPERPWTLVAGTWRRAYRSDDGGSTWRGVFAGMELDSEVFQLRSVPGRGDELWASTCGWVYRSSDLGERWTRFKEGLPERRTPAFAVLEDSRLLAGTIAGLYVSEDAGRSWRRRTDPALAIRAIAHDPRRPERIVLGTEGAGVWISTDGGSSFEPSSRGMTNVRIEAVVVLPEDARPGEAASGAEVLVVVRDAGPFSGIHRSVDGGRTFSLESQVSDAEGDEAFGEDLPTVLDLAVIDDRVYAATKAGLFERRTTVWRRVPELGRRRVVGLETAGGRLGVRTEGGRFEWNPRTHRFEAPTGSAPGGGRLSKADGEVWFRPGPEQLWRPLDTGGIGEILRILDTGDPRTPYVLVGTVGARTFDPSAVVSGSSLGPALTLPFPARDVVAAARVDGRLLLGTTGHGLVTVELPVDRFGPDAGSSVTRK